MAGQFITAIGLMSGTSADGVDALLARFDENGKPEELALASIDYPAKLRQRVLQACQPDAAAELICQLNVELGQLYGKAAIKVAEAGGMKMSDISFIASHGQTIRHQPSSKKSIPSSTLQIGEAAEIAAATGCLVISNFRAADIAAGGQGAPLAPLAHYMMFADAKLHSVVHNIGGISNISWLPAGGELKDVIGFDSGAGNCLLDMAAERLNLGQMDKGGKVAMCGTACKELLRELLAHRYFNKKPPKSTGRELWSRGMLDGIFTRYANLSAEDMLRTLAAFTARSSIRQAMRYFKPLGMVRWIVCGGGVYNKAIMAELQTALSGESPLDKLGTLYSSDQLGIGVKSVEPMLMALLGYRTLSGLSGNLPQVTGATGAVVLGQVTPAPTSGRI